LSGKSDLLNIIIILDSGKINKQVSKSRITSKSKYRIRQNGTGKCTVRSEEREFVANKLLCSSAWSCRTGKRIKSSRKGKMNRHSHKVEENPALRCALDREKKKVQHVVEQIFRTRA
jgi:hypothetical protein